MKKIKNKTRNLRKNKTRKVFRGGARTEVKQKRPTRALKKSYAEKVEARRNPGAKESDAMRVAKVASEAWRLENEAYLRQNQVRKAALQFFTKLQGQIGCMLQLIDNEFYYKSTDFAQRVGVGDAWGVGLRKYLKRHDDLSYLRKEIDVFMELVTLSSIPLDRREGLRRIASKRVSASKILYNPLAVDDEVVGFSIINDAYQKYLLAQTPATLVHLREKVRMVTDKLKELYIEHRRDDLAAKAEGLADVIRDGNPEQLVQAVEALLDGKKTIVDVSRGDIMSLAEDDKRRFVTPQSNALFTHKLDEALAYLDDQTEQVGPTSAGRLAPGNPQPTLEVGQTLENILQAQVAMPHVGEAVWGDGIDPEPVKLWIAHTLTVL